MYLLFIHFLLVGISIQPVFAAENIATLLTKKSSPQEPLFIGIQEEKRNLLTEISNQAAKLEETQDEVAKKINTKIESINNVIFGIQEEIEENRDNQILAKSLSFLKETVLTLKDTLQVRGNLRIFLQEFIKYLRLYLDDSEFESFKKEYNARERLYYTFEDEYRVYNQIITQEALISQLADQEKNLQTEKNNRKAGLQVAQEEHARSLAELEGFLASSTGHPADKKRVEEALRFAEQLVNVRKEWEELRATEIRRRISFAQTKTFVEKMRLDTMKKMFRSIKNSVRIGEMDLLAERDAVILEKKEYLARKEQYQEERSKILTEQKEKEFQLEQLSKELDIPLGKDLDEWLKEPRQNSNSYMAIARVGALNAHVSLLKKELERLQALIALEDEKFTFISIQLKAQESYYRILEHKFFSEDDINQELDSYKLQKIEALSTITQLKERMNAVAEQLGQQKKVLDAIRTWREGVLKQKNHVFKNNETQFTELIQLIEQAHASVQKKLDLLGQLTGAYSGAIAESTNTVRLIDFIINELQTITIWYRPEYAITLQGVQNVGSDIRTFFIDLYSHATRFEVKTLLKRIKNLSQNRLDLFLFLSKLLLLVMTFFFIRRYSSFFTKLFISLGKKYIGLIRFINIIAALFSHFIARHFFGIATWVLLLFLVYQFAPDTYSFVFFYIFSIPYLSYLTFQFMRTLAQFNTQYDYALLSSDFQRRFIILMSALVHATIIIFFFRQAFILASHYRSELPTILLAVNFIIFQISLIFLISKEQILSIIPAKNAFWLWTRTQVERYFYLILCIAITIIIMSNPYIGFGRLVLYMLSNVLYTILFCKLFIWIHGKVKRTTSYIFFFSGEEITRERFAYARTWFGLLIISSFLVLSFLSIIVIAKIWGWPIMVKDIIALINRPFILEQTTTPISLASLLEIIGFILGGFVAAYAVNRFVLDKIFDLLLVDAGVQHATVRLIQYFLVLITVAIGFRSVGLGDFIVWVIGAGLLGIGWNIREPLGDFIAYFVILIQRPIKIGDYIRMENDTQGVVQRITARSVIIRRKNSVTIVIPNSQMITRPIINWNYVRNFVAFDDIDVFVDYREDPDLVKDILYQVVSSHPQILRNPKPIIRLDEFTTQGYRFMVRGFISSVYTLEMWNIASDVRMGIVRSLRAKNIRLALPLRVIIKDHYDDVTNLIEEQ